MEKRKKQKSTSLCCSVLKWLKLFVQMGRVDGYNPHNGRKETTFNWTDVYERNLNPSSASGEKQNTDSCVFCIESLNTNSCLIESV